MELLSMNRWTFLAMGSLFAATAAAQMPQPLMTEDTVKISVSYTHLDVYKRQG